MAKIQDKYRDIELTGNDAALLKVIADQQHGIDRLAAQTEAIGRIADISIGESEALLRSLNRPLPSRPVCGKSSETNVLTLRSWGEIEHEAHMNIHCEVSLSDILPESEMISAEKKLQVMRDKFNLEHRLDVLDWSIAGIAGALAALVDIFLVKIPSSKGLLGGAETQGGVLSDAIRNHLKKLYSPEQIKELEGKFWVPYDASTSKNLAKAVSGLGPRSHRFQSLGHDPVLGFIFGVLDIMHGQFSAIDKAGKLIVQAIPNAPSGIGFFEALAIQFGHLKSDIGTAAGLPAPFMPLFQFLQFGNIDGRTIGELSRTMYAKGYDFGHFIAMSIPVMMIELIVRILYFAKRLSEGHSFMDSLPINLPGQPRKPKLQTMLFTAHTIATASNAGKVYFTANPLAVNLPQWLWYAKSAYSQLKWVAWTKENERLAVVQAILDKEWQHIDDPLLQNWTFASE